MAIAPASRKTDSDVPPQTNAIVLRLALLAASMSNLVSPTVTASAGEMPPSFFNEAAKMSGAGLEVSACSAELYPSRHTRGPLGNRNVASGDRQTISAGGSSAGASHGDRATRAWENRAAAG